MKVCAEDKVYLYNGKEMNADFGLDWIDYGFRWMDPSIGRWHSPDPLAEVAPNLTPFRYGFNNPILYTDPDGLFESRREARRYRRAHRDDIGKSKIKKDRNGSFSIRYGESGHITKTSEGNIEYSSIAVSGQPSLYAKQPNWFERVENGSLGFLGKIGYNITNSASVAVQDLVPHVTPRHLNGDYATKAETQDGLVNTVSTAVPITRSTKAVAAVDAAGATLLKRLNAIQFSKRFKGTLLTRTHPKLRGFFNRLYNKGADTVNNKLNSGSAVMTTAKAASGSDKDG